MTSAPFESFAQNAEDVVLWRALSEVGAGRYIDAGANEPVVDSITWAFYLRGWRGITAEPVPVLAAAHRAQRPGDLQVEAAIGALDADEVVLHLIAGTGLSTISDDIAARHTGTGWQVEDVTVAVQRLDDILAEAGWDDGRDIHLLTIDTEGAEQAVLESIDLHRFRPWGGSNAFPNGGHSTCQVDDATSNSDVCSTGGLAGGTQSGYWNIKYNKWTYRLLNH